MNDYLKTLENIVTNYPGWWGGFSETNEKIHNYLNNYLEFLNSLEPCYGDYKSGSGGHILYRHNCSKLATWSNDHPNISLSSPMCDVHFEKNKNEILRKEYQELRYADVIRKMDL